MKTFCTCCEQWSLLPLDGGKGEKARAQCEHCTAPLQAEEHYSLCQSCEHYYLDGDSICPLCHNATRAEMVIDEVALAYTTEAQTRKSRDGQYFLQLYIDYQENQGATAPVEELHPLPGNGHAAGALYNGKGLDASGYNTNGNGSVPPGNNSLNGHAEASPTSSVDMAITETMPLTLFPEEMVAAYDANITMSKASSAGNYNDFEYELIQDPSRLAEVAEMLAHESVLGIDTETTGLDPHISQLLLLQVSTPDKVYVVDCKRLAPLAFKSLLENNKILKVAQNAKFEYEMLKQQTGITISGLFDTMLAERVMTAGIGRENSLKAIAQKYIGAVLDKSVRESFYKRAAIDDAYLADEELHYAARDAYIMLPIWQQQLPELKKHKLMQVAELEFLCIAAVGDMELAGVKIDEVSWRKIMADVAVQRDKASIELCEILEPATMQTTMFGVPSINLNSNQQLLEAFSVLGVDLPDTMEATLVKFDHPAVKKLLEYRGHEKMLSAFGESVLSLINPKTGRIHPDFNQHGADTGRFSCTKPNVQQIPATSDFRKCFVAPEGYKLVTCVAEGTHVATSRGLLPVEQVLVGDRAVQEDGSLRLVQRVLDQGERRTIRIKTALGYELTVTPEHRVRILDDNGDYVWQEASSLRAGAVIAIKTGMRVGNSDTTIPLPGLQAEHFNAVNRSLPDIVTEELALLLGYLTGDGTFMSDYVGWVVNDHDTDVANYLSDASLALFSYEPKTYTYRGVIEHRLYSKQIKEWLISIGSSKKHVPDFLWKSSERIISAYLRGLFEADGSVQSTATGKISVSTIREELAKQVQELLCALGVASVRRKLEHGKGCGYIWIVTIPSAWNKAFYQRVGFMSERKQGVLNRLLPRNVKQEHGAMPNLQAKARDVVSLPGVTREANRLLANTRNRGSVMTVATAERVRNEAAHVATHLGLHHLLDNALIFDQVEEVNDAGTGRVYDLTVEETSTYITQGFISHNCDYSQAELRILAELSGDEGFVTAFRSGGDLHSITASQMYSVPLEEVQKAQRSAAKAINFGLAYGMGPGGLAPRLGISVDEAKELIARYFKAYPGVQKWLDKAGKDAVRLGYSVTTLGRKRFYTPPDENLKTLDHDEYRRQMGSIERQGKNSPVQGCLSGNTRIFLKDLGYIPIREVSGRDIEVWDGKGFVRAAVVASGQKQLVRMKLRGGHYIECSPDHKFWVACNNGYKWVWKWKIPSEIRKENRVCLTGPVIEWHLPLEIEKAIHSDKYNAHRACITQIEDSVHMAEWLGRIASDGHVCDMYIRIMVAEHEESILEHITSISKQLGHVHTTVRVTEKQPKRFHTLTIGSRGLGRQLLSIGVKDRIPPFVWRDSTVLSSYLRGLFDGDGTVSPDGALLTFGQGDKHQDWAREVQEALLLFGIRSRLAVYTNRHNRINLRILERDMPLFCEKVGFINPKKQEKALQIHADRWERVSPQYGMANLVESIEVTNEWVEMYDVVNSETGQFMANGMIVHNSNADMTKLALINLRAALKGWEARTVNTVHDEIVVEVRADQAEEVKHIVEREMVRAGETILKSVPVVADASLADYWSK